MAESFARIGDSVAPTKAFPVIVAAVNGSLRGQVVWNNRGMRQKTFEVVSDSERKMAAMDTVKPEIARIFAAKEARRHKLAVLPFPEKVRAVVCLQQMAAPVLRARGRRVRVWTIDPPVTKSMPSPADFSAP